MTYTDTQNVAWSTSASVSESMTMNDQTNGTIAPPILADRTETMSWSDSQAVIKGFNGAVAESMTMTDANTATTAYNVNVTETMSIADSNQLDVGVIQSESMTWADSQDAFQGLNDEVIETMQITEEQIVVAAFRGYANETMVWTTNEDTRGWYKVNNIQVNTWTVINNIQ
jgi:hypothetical protein